MPRLNFTAPLELRGVNPFIFVSAARAQVLKPGARGPLPVLLRVNGKPVRAARTCMMPAGEGAFYLYLNGPVRSASASAVGDRVRLELAFDADYRGGPQHPLPPEFRQGLLRTPAAFKHWTALSPSRKKEVLRYYANLRSPEARARNLSRALRVLSGRPERFMGRAWVNGA